MTGHKRKKVKKLRGSKTHGWGAMKKHRGAGNRGGRGMAGTGKRADQKKPSILKEYGNSYFGKRGFNIPPKIKKIKKVINILELPDRDNINLTELGYDKLLGKGEVTKKLKITVLYCSKKAKEKIEAKGGEVITTSTPTKKIEE